MTMPYEVEDTGYSEGQVNSPEPIPVKIVHAETENIAPEYAAWTSWAIPVLGTATFPVQLCPHRYHRYKAKFIVTSTAISTLYISNSRDRLSSVSTAQTTFTVQLTASTTDFALPDYDAQQPVYAIATVAGVTVSVLDESYGVVQ